MIRTDRIHISTCSKRTVFSPTILQAILKTSENSSVFCGMNSADEAKRDTWDDDQV